MVKKWIQIITKASGKPIKLNFLYRAGASTYFSHGRHDEKLLFVETA